MGIWSFFRHCAILISISNDIVRKLNEDYKPLIVAVFLAVGGILAVFLFLPRAGVTETRNLPGAPFLVPSAEASEIDSAAVLKIQDAPFLTSGDPSNGNIVSMPQVGTTLSAGTLEDPSIL
jgi:hypothetical protein